MKSHALLSTLQRCYALGHTRTDNHDYLVWPLERIPERVSRGCSQGLSEDT